MKTVVVTGGTGTVGKKLCKMLVEKGYRLVVLSRKAEGRAPKAGITYSRWDVANGEIDAETVASADYIIHLAGANVADGRWTAKRKQQIVESRTKSCELLVKTLRENSNHVKAVISASATGWYGPDTPASKQNGFTEDAQPATDFLGTTCRLWEESIEPVTELGIRLIKLRTGIVLSNNGGAYAEFKKPLAAGLATIMGNGQQTISWIHVEDVCRMYIYAMESNLEPGAYNAVAPNPACNRDLILTMARQLNGKCFMPVHAPAFVLKAMLGEMSIEILKSVTVSAKKIEDAGFAFYYPVLSQAIEELCNEK